MYYQVFFIHSNLQIFGLEEAMRGRMIAPFLDKQNRTLSNDIKDLIYVVYYKSNHCCQEKTFAAKKTTIDNKFHAYRAYNVQSF